MKIDGRSRRLIDLTGKRFNHLTVLRRAEKNIDGKPAWVCVCDCGNTVTLRGHALKHGQKSCGCMMGVRSNDIVPPYYKKTHNNKLYNQWAGMIFRCTNPSSTRYEYYGGRGITVCAEWLDSFSSFASWSLENGYKENMEIDRIDNSRGYCPENCRWIDHKTNSRNRGVKRTNKTGCAGVSWRPSKTGFGGAWRVGITVDGRHINIGTFHDFDDAVSARKDAELKYWGFNP